MKFQLTPFQQAHGQSKGKVDHIRNSILDDVESYRMIFTAFPIV
jgi:hypothetical protein